MSLKPHFKPTAMNSWILLRSTLHMHRVLPRGKNSVINFYFIEYFQSFVPKNTLYHNRIITSYHFEPLTPSNLKQFKFVFLHFHLFH